MIKLDSTSLASKEMVLMNMDLAIMKGIREENTMDVEEVVVVTCKEGLLEEDMVMATEEDRIMVVAKEMVMMVKRIGLLWSWKRIRC